MLKTCNVKQRKLMKKNIKLYLILVLKAAMIIDKVTDR